MYYIYDVYVYIICTLINNTNHDANSSDNNGGGNKHNTL